MQLEGRVALITGGSSGIGRATALALARKGVRLTVVARRDDRLRELTELVRDEGSEAIGVRADVRNEDELVEAFELSNRAWGQLDVLVCSAGVGRSASYLTGDTADWREMLETNVLALAVASREALKRFDPESGGHIVHLSSLSGHRVPPKGGFYSATKFAVRSMTEGMRLELRAAGNPTRVTQISPGFVATDFIQGLSGPDRERAEEAFRSIRTLDAEDVAASIVHVLEAPDHVAIHDVLLRSNEQTS